jgi:hypothetical protein
MKRILYLIATMIMGVFSITAQDTIINFNIDTTKTVYDVYAEEEEYEDDPYFWSYTSEVGLNMTTLASKFIPFNLADNDQGLVDFKWKKFYAKRAFTVDVGVLLNDLADDNKNKLYLGLGLERRYPIHSNRKWTYSSGISGVLFVQPSKDDFFIGLSKGYGIEYHFSKRIMISTDASLRAGIGDSILDITFTAPVSLYLSVRLY